MNLFKVANMTYLHPPHFQPSGVLLPCLLKSHEHSLSVPELHACVIAAMKETKKKGVSFALILLYNHNNRQIPP